MYGADIYIIIYILDTEVVVCREGHMTWCECSEE